MDKLNAALEALAAACEKRDAAFNALDSADETELDTDGLAELTSAFDEAQAEVDARQATVRKLESIKEARDASPAPVVPERKLPAQPKGTSKAEEIYRPDGQHSVLRDAYLAFKGNAEARSRVLENNKIQLETRDVSTADPGAGSVVPPRYLAEQWMELRRARRVAVNLLPTFDIGGVGTVFTYPKMNTGVSVASQAGELQNFSETDLDTNTLTAYLETIGGLQDVSIQALERTDPALQDIVVQDLYAAYDAEVEKQVLVGAGHTTYYELPGLLGVSGNIDVTWTETTPAGTTGVKGVYNAISQMGTGFATATAIVMHPRRAAWFASQTTTAAPIFSQGGMTYAQGTQDNGFAGTLCGLPVYASHAVPTTRGAGTDQDVIFVLDPSPIRFGEGTPRLEVFREPLSINGGVRFRLFNYVALLSDRLPKAIANLEGTGLKAPTF